MKVNAPTHALTEKAQIRIPIRGFIIPVAGMQMLNADIKLSTVTAFVIN